MSKTKTRRQPAHRLVTEAQLEKGFDPQSLLKRQAVVVELGSGKGRFLRDLSAKHSRWGVVGVEIKRDRARRCALKIEDAGLDNALAVNASVTTFFSALPEDMQFEGIYLNFPDPWPKKRHRRRRLIDSYYVDLYLRHLKPGGHLVFVTDDPNYALQGQEELSQRSELQDVFGGIRYQWPCYPVTIHEEKFRLWGRSIHYQKFVRRLR